MRCESLLIVAFSSGEELPLANSISNSGSLKGLIAELHFAPSVARSLVINSNSAREAILQVIDIDFSFL